ncbi:hypothetical protein [Legionella tunisiensis]|uniref:hypothetical protein n=1 Tax=Legionella tunisiensis TaxID=1034944 RepID=UPI00030F1FCF|nr:hypothetical protein [Legionella tunisiensis]
MLFWRFLVSGLFIAILLIPTMNKALANTSFWELFKVTFAGALFYGACSIFILSQPNTLVVACRWLYFYLSRYRNADQFFILQTENQ